MVGKICFVGAGSMSEAIIAGLVQADALQTEQIYVTNKDNQVRLAKLKKKFGVTCTMDKQTALDDAELVLLATKPHDADAAITSIKPFLTPRQLVISVVAGLSTSYLEERFHTDIPVIRAMPNTSAAALESATAICAGRFATENDVKTAEELFQFIGTSTRVAEQDMHIITAISGSGPAYIYFLIEAMQQAATEAGLDPDVAQALLTQTVVGAGAMLDSTTHEPAQLRKNITSPGGTTEAGIDTLKNHNFEHIIQSCVDSARKRSETLGQ
ncbi:Pyrroline-5-carboxylate reductase [Lentibacillus sp. JNUCC-1]|uniref:pyrroline-5-carboxylate reductase n=1 Tax=Lentibacillus sp. JNUCC-1 TaxID=2654513 RepID=UPI0012E72C91|nr:pyrroline-5-carboxylate reductase [Lentibacillus sp. JNUCC-1]MUV37972.1 Pyrroline-5-carboxylate reductase [Lentibacillus sp. JNUCC-1]